MYNKCYFNTKKAIPPDTSHHTKTPAVILLLLFSCKSLLSDCMAFSILYIRLSLNGFSARLLFRLLFRFRIYGYLNAELAELFLVYDVRCFSHQIGCIFDFRECDDVTDGICMYHVHYHTIQTISQSCVWRYAVTECV